MKRIATGCALAPLALVLFARRPAEAQDVQEKAAVALVQQYVPPQPDKIQAAMAAGKITMAPGAGVNTLRIADYVKAGDSLALTLDAVGRGMQKIDVDTWKDSPSDKVTLDVQMQTLPDGTSYAGTVLLAIPASNLQVRITNSNYQKLAP